MNVVFDHAEPITPTITTFWFRPDQPIDYIAGQFTQIRLPHPNVDRRGDKRWFTLSSSPTDKLLSITTKLAAERPSSFKRTLWQLKPGTPLTLADPMGDFVLPKDATVPLLFIAGGMGITPMHSLIKFLNDTGEQRKIYLVYGVKHADELAWLELFTAVPITFTPIVSEPSVDWHGQTGHLSAAMIADLARSSPNQLVYLSGPEVMVEQFVAELPALGLANNHLVTDYFPGYEPV